MKIVDDGCGRYVLQVKSKDLAKRYNLAKTPAKILPNYNVAPGQIMPVITASESGKTSLNLMQWGLIPVWAKDPRIGYKLINARDDTIFEKPMWKNLILKKRALIPATGFYEWRPPKSPKEPKQPFYIHPRQLGIFSFAGVWEVKTGAEGHGFKTYSIITTEPNKEMAGIHNRMPVILHPDEEADWLDPARNTPDTIAPFLRPYENNGLEILEASTEVNSTANNSKHLIPH